MQIQVNIGFEQLLTAVKTLPAAQLKQLKNALEIENETDKSVDLETLLLNGPTATKKQLDAIKKTEKQLINGG